MTSPHEITEGAKARDSIDHIAIKETIEGTNHET
jgi:hypothetical protein